MDDRVLGLQHELRMGSEGLRVLHDPAVLDLNLLLHLVALLHQEIDHLLASLHFIHGGVQLLHQIFLFASIQAAVL